MKKFLIGFNLMLLAFLMLGCNRSSGDGNTQTYQQALTNGQQAVKANNFAQAEGFYKMASLIKSDDPKSGADYKQAQLLAQADTSAQKLAFTAAKANLTAVITTPDGSSLMLKKAKTQLNLITAVIKNRQKIMKLYQTAKIQNAKGNFEPADAVLTQLLSQKYIVQPEYRDIHIDALTLKANNNAAAAQKGQALSEVPAIIGASSSVNTSH